MLAPILRLWPGGRRSQLPASRIAGAEEVAAFARISFLDMDIAERVPDDARLQLGPKY
jgi:hypothetical protein